MGSQTSTNKRKEEGKISGQEKIPTATKYTSLYIVRLVKQLFSAFEQGDLKTVLEMLTDDVDWQSPATRTKHEHLSWATPRHGLEQVSQFFKEFNEKVKTESFEDLAFTAQGDRVIVEGWNRGVVLSTGRSFEHDWVMVFTVTKDKISRWRQYYDTADIVTAFHPEKSG